MPERKPFLLRIDAGLWTDLESWAQDELRSVNGQIEYVLRQAVQKRKGASSSLPDKAKTGGDVLSKKSSGDKKRR